MRFISCQSTLVAVFVLSLIVVLSAKAKTTQKPKYLYTKKPLPQVTMHNPVTTSAPKTLKIVATPNPVQPQPRPQPQSQPTTVKTTYQSHLFPPHSESTEPPGVGPENYTLDYNECYFNFCECCPSERGPRGLKGERGVAGIKLNDNMLLCFTISVQPQLFDHLLFSLIKGTKVTSALQDQLVYLDHPAWVVLWALKEKKVMSIWLYVNLKFIVNCIIALWSGGYS